MRCGSATLDDPSEISCKYLERITCIREYLQESYKNGVILQVQKNLASFSKESCKETFNRHFLQEKRTNQKPLAISLKIFAFLTLFARFLQFSARIMHYLARNCKKLPKILQVLSERLTRQCILSSCYFLFYPRIIFSKLRPQNYVRILAWLALKW